MFFLAQINPFSRTKHLLARQRWWRNTLTLSDNITVLFESLGIVCPPCFTDLLRVLIHCRLRYLYVLCVSVGLLYIQNIYRFKHQPLFGKRKKERKKWASVLVRGLFLFDSLSYGDSAHEGNGVKRYSTCCIWGRTSGAKMKFHRNQLDEVWIEGCQVILKKLLSVMFSVSTGVRVCAYARVCVCTRVGKNSELNNCLPFNYDVRI